MTPERFRQLALSFPEAVESSHRGKVDFRVKGRIFATLGYPDASWGMVKLAVDDRALLVAVASGTFRPVPGEWGGRGKTLVRLAAVPEPLLRTALKMAWRDKAPRRLKCLATKMS